MSAEIEHLVQMTGMTFLFYGLTQEYAQFLILADTFRI